MEWWLYGLLIFGSLIVLLMTGLPIALCFMLINVVGVYIFWSGELGLQQLIYSLVDSVTRFSLLPIPLFVWMGEVMFLSGIAPRMIDVLDKWLGRLPGRLALLTVGAGTLFATMSGSASGSCAMLGSVLVPEMEKRGYKKSMSIGPVIGSGGLAKMIPPTAIGVLLACLAKVSVGGLLIAIIFPGLLMAIFYASYIIIRCWLQPSLAPSYDITPVPLSERIRATVKYVLPLGTIVFLVIGTILLGIATPTEAAALGCLGCFILAAVYRMLNWEWVKKSVLTTAQITVMMFIIAAGAIAFSQILAFSGASRGLGQLAVSFHMAPIMIIISMQIVVLIMGMFMEGISIMMVTLPIYMPIVHILGFNPLWFVAVMLLNLEMGSTTPPFGMMLFVMKGVAPPNTTMGDIYKAGMPFLLCDITVMALMMAFPQIALWLPSIMR